MPVDFKHPAAAHVEIVDHEKGMVQCVPPRRKAAIVGFAESSRDRAPFHDPEWEIFALNQLYRFIPRADRWFEIHEDFLHDEVPGTDYLAWLRAAPIPVYMTRTHRPATSRFDIPNAVRYPIERVSEFLGKRYFHSSIGFMLALAIMEGFQEIGLWGVDLIETEEYRNQRPNVEWLLGLAGGLGIKVTVDEHSAVLKPLYVYGYEAGPAWLQSGLTPEMLDHREAILGEKIGWLRTQLNAHEGMLLETKGWQMILRRKISGVRLEATSPAEKAEEIAAAANGAALWRDLNAIGVGR